jgi:hypothetical protein
VDGRLSEKWTGAICDEPQKPATWRCGECDEDQQFFCDECIEDEHKPKRFRHHKREKIGFVPPPPHSHGSLEALLHEAPLEPELYGEFVGGAGFDGFAEFDGADAFEPTSEEKNWTVARTVLVTNPVVKELKQGAKAAKKRRSKLRCGYKSKKGTCKGARSAESEFCHRHTCNREGCFDFKKSSEQFCDTHLVSASDYVDDDIAGGF